MSGDGLCGQPAGPNNMPAGLGEAVNRSIWTGMLAAFVALVAAAAPAAAQDKVVVGIEYQVQRLFAQGDGTNLPVGLNFDVAGRIARNLSAVAQVDWSRKSESVSAPGIAAEATVNVTTFGGGIRWSSHANPSVTPFLEGLVGATRVSGSASAAGLGEFSASTTEAMTQVGGGVGFPFSGSGKVGGVAQFDYRRIFAEGEGVNSIRGVFGIRFMMK